MLATEEQVASDIVRNLSEALAVLINANVEQNSAEGREIRAGIETKLVGWIKKL